MKTNQENKNSLEEYQRLARTGKLGEVIPASSLIKFEHDVKIIAAEFNIPMEEMLNGDLSQTEALVARIEHKCFGKKGKRDKTVFFQRKKSTTLFLNYLRFKQGWPTLMYDVAKPLKIYFQPPEIPKKEYEKQLSNSLEDFEHRLLDGSLGRKYMKSSVKTMLCVIKKVINIGGYRLQEFLSFSPEDVVVFIQLIDDSFVNNSDLQQSAMNSYRNYLAVYLDYVRIKNGATILRRVRKERKKRLETRHNKLKPNSVALNTAPSKPEEQRQPIATPLPASLAIQVPEATRLLVHFAVKATFTQALELSKLMSNIGIEVQSFDCGAKL